MGIPEYKRWKRGLLASVLRLVDPEPRARCTHTVAQLTQLALGPMRVGSRWSRRSRTTGAQLLRPKWWRDKKCEESANTVKSVDVSASKGAAAADDDEWRARACRARWSRQGEHQRKRFSWLAIALGMPSFGGDADPRRSRRAPRCGLLCSVIGSRMPRCAGQRDTATINVVGLSGGHARQPPTRGPAPHA